MTAQREFAAPTGLERTRTVLCPVVIARTCGLPPAALTGLAAPELLRAHQALRSDIELLASMGPELADRLTSVVPLLRPAARRPVLSLRRSAHTGRPAAARGDVPAELADVAAADLVADARHYLQLSARLVAGAEQVRLAAGPDLGVDLTALASVLSTPAIRRSLALASPDFARTLQRPLPASGSARRRWLRSAIGYLVRSVLKPSPFGSLTTVAAVPLTDRSELPAARADGAAVVTGTLPLAIELVLAAARSAARSDGQALALRANGSLRAGSSVPADDSLRADGSPRAAELPTLLVPVRLCSDGFFFRDENRLRPVGVPRTLLESTDSGPAGPREWRRRLGVSGAALSRLVEAGVLQPVLPFDPATTRPLEDLSVALPDLPGIAVLAAHERALAGDDPVKRAAAVGGLRSDTAASLAALGRRAPGWLATAPLAHDVVGTAGAPAVPPAPFVADLRRFAAELGRDTVRTVFYDQVVATFIAEYGRGGTCTDLLDFCYRVVGGDRWFRELMAARQIDRRTPVLAAPTGSGTLAPATACVLAQHAVDPTGELLTVVNRMNTGPGALLARWAVRPEIDPALAAHTAWVRDLHPGCRVLSVSAGEDWAPVQRQPAGGLGRLRWPTSLHTGSDSDHESGDVSVQQLGLRLDPVDDTLQVFDRRCGSPVAFAYLGVMPRHLITGPLRVLMTLSDPWVIRTRVGGDVPDEDAASAERSALRQRARRLVAGVVVERRTWSVPVAALPELTDPDEPVLLLDQLQSWWQAMDLPPRVFIAGESAAGARIGKPAFMSLDHPVTAWAALRRPDHRTVRLSISEALPDLLGPAASAPEAAAVGPAAGHAVEWALALRLDGGA